MSRSGPDNPDVLIFYHYFFPDDVVSARHMTDLAVHLADAGFTVEAMPSNRSCRGTGSFPSKDLYRRVRISRIFRPAFKQASTQGRLLNLIWMLLAWSFCAFRRNPDVLIVGTDPILSVLVAIPWKLIRPNTRIVHWCFDLYPDAAVETGLLKKNGLGARVLRRLIGAAYDRCDVIADIGQCMRDRLPVSRATNVTLTPWALAEPDAPLPIDNEERERVFGVTELAIMYSGNFGEAHSFENVLALARNLKDRAVFAFSVRGNRVEELKRAVNADDANIKFVEFAEEDRLERRLACADIHLVTLRDGWEGVVVPSKFFGALAIGRPVLFDGPDNSAIAGWITKHGLGWHLTPDMTDIPPIASMNETAHQVYHDHFSYRCQGDRWVELIRSLQNRR